mmetsp:Transcript_40646/g.127153  ORF Transcript_40646/g.127153 Transcript_40646/m.127153 type:complete len:203 (-) Transcript_40646:1763-2371(-)
MYTAAQRSARSPPPCWVTTRAAPAILGRASWACSAARRGSSRRCCCGPAPQVPTAACPCLAPLRAPQAALRWALALPPPTSSGPRLALGHRRSYRRWSAWSWASPWASLVPSWTLCWVQRSKRPIMTRTASASCRQKRARRRASSTCAEWTFLATRRSISGLCCSPRSFPALRTRRTMPKLRLTISSRVQETDSATGSGSVS